MQPHTGGADAHFHRTFSESFFIVSGLVELYDGRRWQPARAGDFLYVPMGGVHGFRAPSDEPSSMLILFAPGAPRERYFRALAEIRASGRSLTEDEWTEFLAQHDQYPPGNPLVPGRRVDRAGATNWQGELLVSYQTTVSPDPAAAPPAAPGR